MSVALHSYNGIDTFVFVLWFSCLILRSSANTSVGLRSMDGNADEDRPRDHGKHEADSTSGGGDDKSPPSSSSIGDYSGSDSDVSGLEFLPAKKGLSNFYAGQSKSFTAEDFSKLAAESTTVDAKEFSKPIDPYTRKRKGEEAERLLMEDLKKISVESEAGRMSKRRSMGGIHIDTKTGSSENTASKVEGIPMRRSSIHAICSGTQAGSSEGTASEYSSPGKAGTPQAFPTSNKDVNNDTDEDEDETKKNA